MKPLVDIDVDEASGVWSTDGLPMIYVPRHFFINNHNALMNAMAPGAYDTHIHQAGYDSAFYWCSQYSARTGKRGMQVFEDYQLRQRQRGWGQLHFTNDSISTGLLQTELNYSVFVLEYQKHHDGPSTATLCSMFCGWQAGAADWVSKDERLGLKFRCIETHCEAQGHASCRFDVIADPSR
jgi:hypothetical protein